MSLRCLFGHKTKISRPPLSSGVGSISSVTLQNQTKKKRPHQSYISSPCGLDPVQITFLNIAKGAQVKLGILNQMCLFFFICR